MARNPGRHAAHWLVLSMTLGMTACGTAPPPNDVSPGMALQDEQEFLARQAALRGASPPPLLDPVDTPSLYADAAVPDETEVTRGADPIAALAGAAIAEADAAGSPMLAPAAALPTPAGRAPAMAADGRPDATQRVMDFARATGHPVGERHYPRSPFGQGRHEANCATFTSADLAQDWFLSNGGPERDRRALDPDGDGYACGWRPDALRLAAAAPAP